MRKRPRFKDAAEPPKIEFDEPKDPEDIAMNPQKIKEISQELEPINHPRILIVSGPAGSSKSTAVRAICNKNLRPIRDYFERERPTMDSFGDFLVGCTTASGETVVLLDELPNLSHQNTLEKFQESLAYWLELPQAPQLVVVFSEIEFSQNYGEMLLVSRVFANVLDCEGVKHVKCLNISPKYLKKCLKRYSKDEQLITRLAELGDIRQALNGLKMGIDSSLHIRDDKISVFHRIGQIIWASSNVNPLDLLDQDEYDGQFDNHLFENYTGGNGSSLDIHQFARCSEYLSIGDAYGLGTTSYALHTIMKSGSSRRGSFLSMQLSKQATRRRSKADFIEKLSREQYYVRESTPVNLRDIILNHGLGLENIRPPIDIYLSDSDDEFD